MDISLRNMKTKIKKRRLMKSKFKGRSTRTSGWETQTNYDWMLSDLDVSSLRFLSDEYTKRIRDFSNHFDLGDKETQHEYQELLQRKKMIIEELDHRYMDIYASPSYQDREKYFDSETGLVLDENNNILYGVSLNENEDDYVYHHIETEHRTEGSYDTSKDIFDDITNDIEIIPMKVGKKVIGLKVIEKERSLKDVYSDWNYYENEEEEN